MGKDHHHNTRRDFLGSVSMGCASLGFASLFNSISNMGLLNAAAAANLAAAPPDDYKALVCILLRGGNDSFNMLIPRGASEYQQYAEVRAELAMPQNELLTLNATNTPGLEFGLHPSMPRLQGLFEQENAAFIANIGALVRPITMADFLSDSDMPVGLFSHFDQRMHWQTAVPQDIDSLGWGGRMADILHTTNDNQNISMNISMSGVNVFQRGSLVTEYAISHRGNGSVLINNSSSNNFHEVIKRQTVDNLVEQNYNHILQKAYSDKVRNASASGFEFDAAIANAQTVNTPFETNPLGNRLKMVAKTIAARNILGVKRQTFYVEIKGWDTHDSQTDHAKMLTELDNAVGAFYDACVELGVENEVVGFTASDFGRKLVTNGNGTDHAWGGNVFAFGNPIKGKKIFGQYPELYVGNPLDIGGGRLIPTTSCDQYFAELALWFGASVGDLDQILPNINNFWIPNANEAPLGFLI